jgi:hypothetical protein
VGTIRNADEETIVILWEGITVDARLLRFDFIVIAFKVRRRAWGGGECGHCPDFACYTLTFTLQLNKDKTSRN